jgi:hypothetical protein
VSKLVDEHQQPEDWNRRQEVIPLNAHRASPFRSLS